MTHRLRKRFGQHFLHDPRVIQNILQAIDPKPEQHLVEIGPGQGAITFPLLKHLKQLEVVEIDRDLIQALQHSGHAKLIVHAADALRFDFCSLCRDSNDKLRLFGNLPYNISTPLLFHLFRIQHCIADMHFMLQKEVVDRMLAPPGDKTYGRLSVMVQYYCEVIELFDIGPGAFTPPPKVHSAIVRLLPHATPPVPCTPERLYAVVNQAFSQRRKTLRNAVNRWLSAEQIQALDIDPGLRPERLSLSDFAKLANAITFDTDESPAAEQNSLD
jgi:16S rRNA (adenine1518-N6/adenine1519-N6)-dimethyltransferase